MGSGRLVAWVGVAALCLPWGLTAEPAGLTRAGRMCTHAAGTCRVGGQGESGRVADRAAYRVQGGDE